MVQTVAAATAGSRDDNRLVELGAIAEQGLLAWQQSNIVQLGSHMNRAQQLLAELGVSTTRIAQLCATAERAGALGCKLTGAGGGGSVIAIADDIDGVVEAWKHHGIDGFVATIAGSPSSKPKREPLS
jgi:mevalonate kinase